MPALFPRSGKFSIGELLLVLFIVGISFHLVSERIAHAGYPTGDEGSWMSAAAEVSRGHGFTTLWYEHPFLLPATLPRHDDFRYPGLVLPLALSFRLFGISFVTALWTVGAIFILFLLVVYVTCRRAFSVETAVLTMAVSAMSLLQLYWNTRVYSEGLFGLITGLLILWTISDINKNRALFWIVLGAGCGLLYNVRPNGLLFGAGIAWIYFRERKNGVSVLMPLAAYGSMALIMAPWLIRTWMCFGNPFHVAGNAGLLHGGAHDPATLSVIQFFSLYGPFVIIKNTVLGIFPFIKAAFFFEHRLLVLPVIGVAAGLIAKKKFYGPFAGAAVCIMLAACIYVSVPWIGSWAGIRYFSPLLPFIYGYGIFSLLSGLHSLAEKRIPPFAVFALHVVIIAALFGPLYYPHRHFERVFADSPAADCSFLDHRIVLDKRLGKDGTYFADKLGQLNFLTTHRCVGLQYFVDSSNVPSLANAFSPSLVALTPEEADNPRIQGIMREIAKEGYTIRLADSSSVARYYDMAKQRR